MRGVFASPSGLDSFITYGRVLTPVIFMGLLH